MDPSICRFASSCSDPLLSAALESNTMNKALSPCYFKLILQINITRNVTQVATISEVLGPSMEVDDSPCS